MFMKEILFILRSLFPPSLSNSFIKKNSHFVAKCWILHFCCEWHKNLTHVLWENNFGSVSLRESFSSCEGLPWWNSKGILVCCNTQNQLNLSMDIYVFDVWVVNWWCVPKTLLILSLHQVLPSCLRPWPLHDVETKLVKERLLEVASDLL